jgi:hypothetical protein
MRRPRLRNVVWLLGLLVLVALGTQLLRRPKFIIQGRGVSRLSELRELVNQQESVAAGVLDRYVPTAAGRLDDLSAPVGALLRQLPGVVDVQIAVSVEKPTHRVVHLLDWHFVPKELYRIDLQAAAGRPLTDEELDELHEQLCMEVELVQLEQMAILRCLIKHHGLRRVYAEGLTEKDLAEYKADVTSLRVIEKGEISELRKHLEETRGLKKSTNASRREEATAIEEQLMGMLWEHKRRLLRMGAAGRLLISGEIDEVLPLDDAELHDKAKPITPDGRLRFDKAMEKAREDACVRIATAEGPLAVILLGGAHNLADSIRRVARGRCEYIRVTTRRFKEISEHAP